ncbi:MAG TPA: STAS domain-containing protein [Spirochaetota bacterium]|nr:STAS domain-containing protein [Spirochaetota bacterium]HPH02530.1 STAS domain-containing protein [Spirochaetota bacterium]HPN82630.1 STAS domain-containing protein [Spirochaetota bacterium]
MKYEFSLESTMFCGIPVILLQGDITAESDSRIKEAWDVALQYPSEVIAFEFSRTKYVNSAGVATLLSLVTRAVSQSRKVLFVGLTAHFRKVVELIGMTDFVQVADTMAEYVAGFGPDQPGKDSNPQ